MGSQGGREESLWVRRGIRRDICSGIRREPDGLNIADWRSEWRTKEDIFHYQLLIIIRYNILKV